MHTKKISGRFFHIVTGGGAASLFSHPMVSYRWHGQTFVLHPQRCLYWESQQALVLADLHLGKTGHFRKEGIAVPQQVYREDLRRLFDLISFFSPQRVWLAGDLFHSRANSEWEWFAGWRKDFKAVDFTLVLGNHDKLPAGMAEHMELSVVKSLEVNGLLVIHDPGEPGDAANNHLPKICGHIHPAVLVPTGIKQSARLPCFHFSENTCTLPAFSLFTGTHLIKPRAHDRVFVLADGKILEL